jgi:hypothetical protein
MSHLTSKLQCFSYRYQNKLEKQFARPPFHKYIYIYIYIYIFVGETYYYTSFHFRATLLSGANFTPTSQLWTPEALLLPVTVDKAIQVLRHEDVRGIVDV